MRPRELGKRDTTMQATRPAISTSGDNPFGSGFWVAQFDAGILPQQEFVIYRMTIRGPAGAQINLYVDHKFVAGTARASLNEWQGEPIPVDPTRGESVTAYWSTAATPAPYLAFYMRAAQ